MTRTGRDVDVEDDAETTADDRSEPTAATRRATIRTTHGRAEAIAAAVRPDNTPEMDTRVEDGTVVTTVERGTTGGLQSTVDDYVVNLSVAADVVETVRARNRHRDGGRGDGGEDHPENESHTNATEPEHESDTDSKEHS